MAGGGRDVALEGPGTIPAGRARVRASAAGAACYPAETRWGKPATRRGGALGTRRLKPHVGPRIWLRASRCTDGDVPTPCGDRVSPPGMGCPDAPAEPHSARPHQGFPRAAPSAAGESRKLVGGTEKPPSCSSFCSSCWKQWGKSNILRNGWSPGPLAGGHRVPSEWHYLSGGRGQSWLTSGPGASAPGRRLAPGGCGHKTLAGPCPAPGQGPAALQGSQPGWWRGSQWPGPAQRGPGGDYGNQKVLLEEDEPQQVGAAGACSRLAALRPRREGSEAWWRELGWEPGCSRSSDWGARRGMWVPTGSPDAWVLFLASGKSLG